MKKISLFLLLFIVYLFYLKNNSFAQHACNQSCSGASNITCNEQTGSLSYNPGSCASNLACYSGAGGRCRNPYCPDAPDCNCSNFSVSGNKVGMPNNQDIEPFRSQTVYLDFGLISQRETSSQPYSFTGIVRNTIHYLSVNNLSGSSIGYTLCYNSNTCHNNTPTPAPSNNRIYLCSNQINSYASLWWHYTPLTANSTNINGPTSVFVGDEVIFSADYQNYNASLTEPLMYVYNNTCLGTPLTKTSQGNSPGIHTFRWVPTEAGNYIVYTAANSSQATCIGYDNCVGNPPQYLCAGPNTYLNITVQNPQPWYKLKDASLNKIGDHNISVAQNVSKFTDGDPDDNTDRYVIIGNSDLLISSGNYNPGPSYNPINASINNFYSSNYSDFNYFYLDNFYQYLVSRKLITNISSLSDINTSGVYSINTDALNLTPQTTLPNYNFVLVVRNQNNDNYGDVNISINDFNSSKNSIAILAKDITTSNGVQYINGIFIASGIFSYQNSEGLKIFGNLVSKNTVTLQDRSDNTRPSLFVVFSPKMYLDLLPYLSIAKYDWQQIQ